MRVRVLGLIRRWETLLVVLLIAFVVLGSSLSPYFLSASNFSDLTSNLMEKAIMALPLALVIIAGEIDLSVESMLGLASALLGFTYALGWPLWLDIPLVLVVGAMGGLLNGVLVTRAGLPSPVVTLGPLALHRGLRSLALSLPSRGRRQRSGLRARRRHLGALGWREHLWRRGHDRRRRAGDLRHRCLAQRTHAGRREPRYAERRGRGASDSLGRRPHPGAPDQRGLAATSADESSQQFMRRLDAMRWRRGSQFALAGMTILVVAAW